MRASLVDKLRKKAQRDKPALRDLSASGPVSSALPPGSAPPKPRARLHELLAGRPELLEGARTAADFDFSAMSPSDAVDMNDLQLELFPEESYPDGLPWCEELLAHDGVVAIKASLPDDPDKLVAGFAVALCTRASIEHFLEKPTVEMLRKELTCPRYIPWDTPSRRELGYVLSVGVAGEMRRRGLAAELLRRVLAEMEAQAPDGVRAVALDLADYNTPAIKCYEQAGFVKVMEQPESYAGEGRRTHSAYLYARFSDEASST